MGVMQHLGIVHAERIAGCPFSVAQEYAEDYLRDAELGSEGAVLFAGPLARRVHFRFGRRSDVVEEGRPHDEIVLRWFAKSPLLPDFVGTLRMRIANHRTLLVLDGRYATPAGPLGAICDRVIAKRIARATAHDFLRRVADALGLREHRWRAETERGDVAP
ncbi:MAG: hypothetical protein NVS3B7_17660 [Candidatus Elarobacter sp.]